METVTDFLFLSSKITADGDHSHEIKRHLLLGRKAVTTVGSILKKQRHYFANRGLSSQSYLFSSSQVWIWELDLTQSWVPRNLCFLTMVLEKTLESPFDSKEFKLVNPKGNQSWIFIGCWSWNSCILPTWSKNWLTGNTLMLGKIEDRRKRWWQRMMVECRDQLDGHEFKHVPGVGDGQGSLACFSPWGLKEFYMTDQLK